MTYAETLDYLFSRLPMFQRSGPAAYKNNLENTLLLDGLYGHPHCRFRSIHVGGTNGKGSVSHMLSAILQSAGYKTGLYTSPHLKDFRERIRIDGKMMGEQAVAEWVGKYIDKSGGLKIEPSFFELTVAMAFDYFASQHVDVAVIEVGLGGRLDSTNIILPEVSVITNIGLDHTNLLGETLGEIAMEKAGIIKSQTPVVVGSTQAEISGIFKTIADEKMADVFFADQVFVANYALLGVDGKQVVHVEKLGETVFPGLKLDLLGNYQLKNLHTVLKTVEVLRSGGWEIQDTHVYDGLQNVVNSTGLQGRWQIIGNNPLIVADTGHNEDGIKMVLQQIKNTAFKNLHVVFGTVGDKNPDAILKLLPQNAAYYFANANIPRAMNAKLLKQKAGSFGLKGRAYRSVKEAFGAAIKNAGKNDFIFVGGSTFVVAEIV